MRNNKAVSRYGEVMDMVVVFEKLTGGQYKATPQ